MSIDASTSPSITAGTPRGRLRRRGARRDRRERHREAGGRPRDRRPADPPGPDEHRHPEYCRCGREHDRAPGRHRRRLGSPRRRPRQKQQHRRHRHGRRRFGGQRRHYRRLRAGGQSHLAPASIGESPLHGVESGPRLTTAAAADVLGRRSARTESESWARRGTRGTEHRRRGRAWSYGIAGVGTGDRRRRFLRRRSARDRRARSLGRHGIAVPGVELAIRHRLQVIGRAAFSRSGKATVLAGQSGVTVPASRSPPRASSSRRSRAPARPGSTSGPSRSTPRQPVHDPPLAERRREHRRRVVHRELIADVDDRR